MLQLFCAAMLLPLSGCQKDGLEPAKEPAVAKGQIELSFKGSADKDARSSLNGSYVDYRTVKNVWVLIFKGIGHSATLVYKEDVGWKGDIEQTYKLTSQLDEGRYTLLAIGVDDKAGATYQLPEGIAVGTTLRTTQASLAAGAGADDMAHSDFYVAQEQITVHATTGNLVSMTLRRRESGVQVYLKNIPYTVNYYSYDYKVDRVRVKLYDDQHTSVLLFDPNKVDINNEANWPADPDFSIWDEMYFKYIAGYGTLPESSTLMEFNMTGYQKSANGNYYEIPASTSPATLENTLYGGAFVLPIDQPASWATNTLVIELWTDDMATGVIIDEPIKTYVVKKKLNSSSSTNCYALEGNHLYSVGQKLSAETTEGDNPADLSGNIIEVYAADYDLDSLVEVDFPPISQPAYIDPDFNPEKYIFNCIHTTEYIEIDDSYPAGKAWKLTIPVDWIHIVQRDDQGNIIGYTRELEGVGHKKVELFINDYVEERMTVDNGTLLVNDPVSVIKNDYRTADLQLYTSGTGQTTTLPIRQYNAISVKYFDPDGSGKYFNFGLSRLDFGCTFDRQTGEVIRPAESAIVWGYFSTDIYYIFDSAVDDFYCTNYKHLTNYGWRNCYQAKRVSEERDRADSYPTSILGKTYRIGQELTDEGSNLVGNLLWYLPAYHEYWEMHRLLANLKDKTPNAAELNNLNFDGSFYWTSTGDTGPSGTARDTYTVPMVIGDHNDYLSKDKRSVAHYCRLARLFTSPQ